MNSFHKALLVVYGCVILAIGIAVGGMIPHWIAVTVAFFVGCLLGILAMGFIAAANVREIG